VASTADEIQPDPDNFVGLYARAEIFALAGLGDAIAVCVAKRPVTATVAVCVDPSICCATLMALPPGVIWPNELRRKITVAEAWAGGAVMWLYQHPTAAQAALARLQKQGATVHGAAEPKRPQ